MPRKKMDDNESSKSPEFRSKFTLAMVHWLQRNHFEIGLPEKDISGSSDKTGLSLIFKAAQTVLSLDRMIPAYLFTADVKAERLIAGLTPIMAVSDLVGYRVLRLRNIKHLDTNRVISVVYADDLAPADLFPRLLNLLESSEPLCRMGIRYIRGIGNEIVTINPLLVYFDKKKFASAVGEAKARSFGSFKREWSGFVVPIFLPLVNDNNRIAFLEPEFINVPAGEAFIFQPNWMPGFLAERFKGFNNAALREVLKEGGFKLKSVRKKK
jgi:hypothetical protein